MNQPRNPRRSIDLHELRARAESRLGPDGELPEHADLGRVVHELRVHQAELQMQNEELRRTETELMASRDRFRRLYDQAPFGYATLDPVGRLVDANVTLCERLGCERRWLLGRPLSSLMSEAHADALHLHLRAVLEQGTHQSCEVALRHTSGALVHVRLESSPSLGTPAEHGQVLTAIIDLTDLRHAERDARTSEAQAQNLLDTATDGILILDAENRIETMNAAARHMFGYDEAALRGRSIATLLAPPIPTCVERYLDTGHCERGSDETVFVEGRRKDGSEIPLELGLGSWHSGGEPRLTVLLRDVTEQRLAQQRLRESEVRLREIATYVDDVLYVREQGGRLTYVSPAYDELWGQPASSALADPKGWLDAIDPRDVPAVDQARRRLTQGEAFAIEYRITRPDGTTRWIRDRAWPVRDAAGIPRRFVGVARDITHERQLEDELRQVSKMDAVNTLAAGIAHDFRNLLHGVAGCVAVAERHLDDPETARSYLAQIRDATRRGTALTDQLNTFSRRQEGESAAPLLLDTLIENTAPLLMRLMGEQIRVVLQLNAPSGTIAADPVQIERILMNLAANASDAMPSGGTVVIRTETVIVDEDDLRPHAVGIEGRCVRLEFRDTGTGIDDATRERIFEPFFTTKDFGKGTGLGLAAVFGITRELRGHVAVDSTVGAGTTFTFWLPRCAPGRRREPTAPHELPTLSSTVLLVEDDPLVRMSVRSDLERLGMHVIEARDPRHALGLAKLLRPPPALLISDVMMPDMTGPRLADELCTTIPDLRVLLISAHAAEDLIERGTVPPYIPLLRKPFDQATLARRVLEVLGDSGPSATPPPARTAPPIRSSATPPPPPAATLPPPPAATLPPARPAVPRPAVPRPRPASTPKPASSMEGRTILVVDDDENGRAALAMLLEDEGMRVLTAASPAEALRLAGEPLDVLITDLNLPQMRGDELVRRFIARRSRPIEVLYLSGEPAPADLDPMAEYALKPVDFDELVERIHMILSRRHAS